MKNHKKGPTRSAYSTAVVGGFTLIELLVVVAIIGILAAVVLAVLGNAKDKGSDAAVKSNLVNAAKQAEIFYNVNSVVPNSYTSVCTNGTVGGIAGAGVLILAAAKASSLSGYSDDTAGSLTVAVCNDSANAWASQVPLKSVTDGAVWCVDSAGASKQSADSLLTAGDDYVCD